MKIACVILGAEDWKGRVSSCISAVKDVSGKAKCEIFIFSDDIKIAGSKGYVFRHYVSEAFSLKNMCAETVLPVLEEIAENDYDCFIFDGTDIGNELAVRLSCRLDSSCLTNVENFYFRKEGLYAVKGAYGHNLKAEYLLTDMPYCIGLSSVNMTDPIVFDENEVYEKNKIDMETPDWINDVEFDKSENSSWEKDIKILLVGGLGVGSKEGINKLAYLANKMGAELAGSRPAVMSGWLPIDRIIGMSGKIVAPELCITFGVAGSMAFMIGIEKSKTLISVNDDPAASIFSKSDSYICADWQDVVDEILKVIDKNGKKHHDCNKKY